jgi:hypothetical protein
MHNSIHHAKQFNKNNKNVWKRKKLPKVQKWAKKKHFSCHTERRKTQRLEMESANIVLTADGGMGGGGDLFHDSIKTMAFVTSSCPMGVLG